MNEPCAVVVWVNVEDSLLCCGSWYDVIAGLNPCGHVDGSPPDFLQDGQVEAMAATAVMTSSRGDAVAESGYSKVRRVLIATIIV